MTDLRTRMQQSCVLFDGAMGSQLIDAGLKRGESSESWNLNHPDIVIEIQTGYAEAGADVLTTNTFGATRGHLERHGLDQKLEIINRTAVELARTAGPDCLIAGDIGPTGQMFPPMGKADHHLISDLVFQQAEVLIQAGVDLVLIETQVDLKEAVAACSAVRKISDLPLGVTMTYNRTRRGYFTMVGNTVDTCCGALADAGADFVGANCSLIPEDMTDLTARICAATTLPVLIQPNAGQPVISKGEILYNVTPESFAQAMRNILSRGARMIGGCCGTAPGHIMEVRRSLSEYFSE